MSKLWSRSHKQESVQGIRCWAPPGANSDMTTVVLELRTQSQGSPATNTEQPERDRRVSCRRNRTVRTGTAAMPGDSKRLESNSFENGFGLSRLWLRTRQFCKDNKTPI